MELVQACILGKFGFSRPDLVGNKLAKVMCLARKTRGKKVFIVVPRVVNFFCFELNRHPRARHEAMMPFKKT